MDTEMRSSKNIDVAESYGLGDKKLVLRSNYGLTERNGEEN